MTDETQVARARADFMRRALEARVFLDIGVRGVWGRGPVATELVERLEALITPHRRAEGAERLCFPPLTPREVLRKVGYMDNFPHLCGSVHSFMGTEREHAALTRTVKAGEAWDRHLRQTEVCLTPAACYPLYPTLSGQRMPEGGKRFDFTGQCFRHEPSDDPARMQSFQVREGVCAGAPAEVQAWRKEWMHRGRDLLASLALPVRLEEATDPFFGRGGRLLKANQQAAALKFELLVPIWSDEEPTAVASFNYHQEHFAHVFDIKTSTGEQAHTACLGFGLDRIAVALLKHHGLDPAGWPAPARQALQW